MCKGIVSKNIIHHFNFYCLQQVDMSQHSISLYIYNLTSAILKNSTFPQFLHSVINVFISDVSVLSSPLI